MFGYDKIQDLLSSMSNDIEKEKTKVNDGKIEVKQSQESSQWVIPEVHKSLCNLSINESNRIIKDHYESIQYTTTKPLIPVEILRSKLLNNLRNKVENCFKERGISIPNQIFDELRFESFLTKKEINILDPIIPKISSKSDCLRKFIENSEIGNSISKNKVIDTIGQEISKHSSRTLRKMDRQSTALKHTSEKHIKMDFIPGKNQIELKYGTKSREVNMITLMPHHTYIFMYYAFSL